MSVHHPLIKPPNGERAAAKPRPPTRRDTPAPPQWPSYTGTSQYVGTSRDGRVTVYVDPTLGAPGLTNAQDLVNDADRVAAANDTYFGTPSGNVSVIVFALDGATDGTGGADHMGCDYVNGAAIEVDASFGNPARVSALFEAELSECSMNNNLCGANTGEALSRLCAAIVSGNALSDFATAPTWYNDGMPDYVNVTDPSDTHPDSTGCGMAFLSWILSLGYGISEVAPAMVSLGDAATFADLYNFLTSDDAANAWPNFQAAVQALPNGITDDDPFGGYTQPAQMPHLAPWTVEVAGKIFSAILKDVAAGKSEHQIAAGVRAVLATSSPKRRKAYAAAGGAACSTTSHRLQAPTRA